MNTIKEGVDAFVAWTKLKIRIHLSSVIFYPRKRQIWWVSLGQNVGVEINGKNDNFERPVLVLKRYNDEACLVVPITSKIKTGSQYIQFKKNHNIVYTVILSQIRSISTKRFLRKVEKMNQVDFNRIKQAIVAGI
jgi:mRNA interferase MazF